jgi:hypothetical protein
VPSSSAAFLEAHGHLVAGVLADRFAERGFDRKFMGPVAGTHE